MTQLTTAQRLSALLDSCYDLPSAELTVVWEQPNEGVYRLDETLIVRATRTRPMQRVRGDADVLLFLEAHRIPAERLVLTAAGETAAELDGYRVLVTRYVRGRGATWETHTMQALGETLGRIHALPPAISRRAGSLPVEDLAHAHDDLDSLDVPDDRKGELAMLRSALERTSTCVDLPQALVHPDIHPGNAIVTDAGEVVLIDWVGAGLGPRVASLGVLLAWAAVGGPQHVDAVWHGYASVSALEEEERAALDSAVRFRPLAIAVRQFAASVRRGDATTPEGWWDVYGCAEEIANRIPRAR